MIRLLLVDSESLLDASGGRHPDAPVALGALSRLETFEGECLRLVVAACGQAAAQAAHQAASLGFANLLAPGIAVELPPRSDRAGREAFAVALRRVMPGVRLETCAAVLRDEDRVLSCRSLGIPAIAPGFDKMGWRDVPLLVARLMDPSNLRNLGLALSTYLPPDVEDAAVVSAEPKRLVGRAKRWSPVPADSGLPQGLHVLVPVELSVKIEREGARLDCFAIGAPSAVDVDDAVAAAREVFASGRVALAPDAADPAATHHVERQDGGRRLLLRARGLAG